MSGSPPNPQGKITTEEATAAAPAAAATVKAVSGTLAPPPARNPAPKVERKFLRGGVFLGGIQRGHVFWVDIPQGETRGSEQYKSRPWVVLSNNEIHSRLAIVQAAPLTLQPKDNTTAYRFHRVRIPVAEYEHFDLPSNAGVTNLDPGELLVLTEQARALSHERLRGVPVAKVKATAVSCIEAGLLFVFGIPPA